LVKYVVSVTQLDWRAQTISISDRFDDSFALHSGHSPPRRVVSVLGGGHGEEGLPSTPQSAVARPDALAVSSSSRRKNFRRIAKGHFDRHGFVPGLSEEVSESGHFGQISQRSSRSLFVSRTSDDSLVNIFKCLAK
jgi:hypothetical protein